MHLIKCVRNIYVSINNTKSRKHEVIIILINTMWNLWKYELYKLLEKYTCVHFLSMNNI